MPTLTRWFIKAALIFFVAALLVGVLMAANQIWSLSPILAVLGPVYFHLFLVGWITQLIFGVVFWMFPKQSLQKPRGHESLAWAAFWLVNAGLLLRVVGEPAQALQRQVIWGWVLVLSAVLQWAAGLLFVANAWPRVKEK